MFKRFILFLLGLFSAASCIAPSTVAIASAAETPDTKYTSVLEDLQKDATFDINDYPYKANDYSLQVLQVAESVNDELFVYVYQPSAPSRLLEATTIRLSTSEPNESSLWHDYDLTLISAASVFHKYRVEELTVKDTSTRYYDITAIHRLWQADIDAGTSTNTDQTVNEVVFKVGKIYKATSDDNGAVAYYHASDVITVTGKVTGYIYYENPSIWSTGACDRHIVAFSVDRDIDNLYEVDVEYKAQRIADGIYNGVIAAGGYPLESATKKSKTVKADKHIIYDDFGGFVDTHFSFKEIMSAESFLNETGSVTFVKGAYDDLKKTDFVLTFDVTNVEQYGTILTQSTHYGKYRTSVSDVTIIRLKFEVNGEMYNLGVVDNKQTGIQLGGDEKDRINWLLILVIVLAVALVALIIYLMIRFPTFRKFVFGCFKGGAYIIAWPVLLIILIVEKAKGG